MANLAKKVEFKYKGKTLVVIRDKYYNENTALIAYDKKTGEEYADITTNIGMRIPPEGVFCDWNNSKDLVEAFEKAGYIRLLSAEGGSSGFCTYPLYRLVDEKWVVKPTPRKKVAK